jgi:holo-[acyl-carrier protein] synthase
MLCGVIVAVGIDLIELHRIAKILESRHGQRFLERTYTPSELAYCLGKKNPVPSLAARFAAKEAFQKTWFEAHGWHDVWVEFQGVKPVLRLAPKLEAAMQQNGWKVHLSLSHTLENAVASVLLEQI